MTPHEKLVDAVRAVPVVEAEEPAPTPRDALRASLLASEVVGSKGAEPVATWLLDDLRERGWSLVRGSLDDGLSEAWAEAEAALPEGWQLSVKRDERGRYYALALGPNRGRGRARYSEAGGWDVTPALALRSLTKDLLALAERLQEAK